MTKNLLRLIDRLEGEHVEVLDAVARVRAAVELQEDVALKAALAAGEDALGAALTRHSEVEDVDLFPRIAAMLGEGMVSLFVEEHVRIRALRDQVYERMGQGRADFGGCAELCDLLTDHMTRENQMLFPSARGVLND
ncbi:MAG: hemerythrin domain-containing protein [Actinomycetota bacterium]